jgi:hypothetical protein
MIKVEYGKGEIEMEELSITMNIAFFLMLFGFIGVCILDS